MNRIFLPRFHATGALWNKNFRIRSGIFFLVLLSWGVIIYSNSFQASFQFDDRPQILQSVAVRFLFRPKLIWESFASRFLTYWTFALNYQIGRWQVFGYHVFNFGIHVLASFMVYLLLRVTFLTPALRGNSAARHRDRFAILASLLFLCHPIQTQAVTYIVQRAASMATLFYLATVYLTAKARLSGKWIFYSLALVSACAATFSKEISYTLPFALLLYEVCFFGIRKKEIGERLIYYSLFFLPLAVAYVTIYHGRVLSNGILSVINIESDASHGEYALTQLNVIRTYLRLLFVPLNQNADYDYAIAKSLFEPQTFLSLLLFTGLLFTGIKSFSRHRLISFGIFWFILTLSMESSIVRIKDVIFEHRLYLPMFGFVTALMSTAFLLIRNKNLLLIGSVLVTLVLSVMTFQRNRVWKDELTLWQDVVQKSPNKPRAYGNLGYAYYRLGKLAEAREYMWKALEMKPDYPEAHYIMAGILEKEKKESETFEQYVEALRLKPDYVDAWVDVGNILKNAGKLAEAVSHYLKALKINPNSERAHYHLGQTLVRLGDFDQAIWHYMIILELDPEITEAHRGLAVAFALRGEFEKAIEHYREALKMNPEDGATRENMEILQEIEGQSQEKKREFVDTLRTKYTSQEVEEIPDYVTRYLETYKVQEH